MSIFSLKLRSGDLKEFPKPCVMGIINTSPDSFYHPTTYSDALFLVEKMIQQGAEMIDVGGVATNPFVHSERPSLQQEIDRVVPLVEAIAKRFDIFISVDTSEPEIMCASVKKGAALINDQKMLQVPGAAQAILDLQVPVCLMHSFVRQRQPGSCTTEELLKMIQLDLETKISELRNLGMDNQRIIIDPGFGQGYYGKNKEENFYLLANIRELMLLKYPVLVGWSRKSMIGDALGGKPPEERLVGSIAAATIAGYLGASIIRTHDVEETVQAMKIVQECRQTLNLKHGEFCDGYI